MKLRWLVDPKNGNHRFGIVHYCPGCDMRHVIYIAQQTGVATHPVWTWNQQFNEHLTTHPSVHLKYGTRFNGLLHPSTLKPDQYDTVEMICHYFITDGQIQYCGDSTHKLAGRTIPLPDISPEDE